MRIVFLLLIGINIFLYADFTRGNGTVLDNNTGLEWQDFYNDEEVKSINWIYSFEYCENLVLDDKDDWRVPNINELLSLLDDNKNSAPHINSAFKETISGTYLSSTSGSVNKLNYMWLDFTMNPILGILGESSKYYYGHAYIRCVRKEGGAEAKGLTLNR